MFIYIAKTHNAPTVCSMVVGHVLLGSQVPHLVVLTVLGYVNMWPPLQFWLPIVRR